MGGLPAIAGPVKIPESYADDPGAAWFPAGPVGRCLGLFTGAPLEYPVWFSVTNASSGTMACWFKPTRSGHYDGQTPLQLGKIGGIGVSHAGGRERQRLVYPGGARWLSNDFCRAFHHAVFTWTPEREQTWLDGEKIYEKEYGAGGAPARPAGDLFVSMRSPHGTLVDEALVLDRALTEAEIKAMHQAPAAWQVDSNTVFYAGMEGTLAARGWVKGGGDVVRMAAHVGRVDATFRAGEPARLEWAVLNAGASEKSLRLRGAVKDLDRRLVLEREVPVAARAGELTMVPFGMEELAAHGLFWGEFKLLDGGCVLQETKIQFARTLAVNPRDCTGEEMRSGFTVAKGVNAPTYQKWGLIHYDGWAALEPEEDEWYFDRLDLKVNSLLAAGTIPIIMLDDPPEWFRKQTGNTAVLDGYYYPDADDEAAMAKWRRYVRTVAERYKGLVHDYEIFGEAYGRSDADHYGKLVNISAEELHAVDPAIRVACNISHSPWSKKVAAITAGKADYYTIHPYGFVGGRDPGSLQDDARLAPILDMLKAAGANPVLANTEYGCYQVLAWGIREDGYPMTPAEFEASLPGREMPAFFIKRGRDSFTDWHTTAFRAVRGYVLNLALNVKYALWWSSIGGSMISDLQYAPHTPSPASVSYANAVGILAGTEFVRRMDLGGAASLKGYLFKRGAEFIIAAWTDEILAHRSATVYLELAGAEVEVLDIYGNAVATEKYGGIYRLDFHPNAPLYVTGIAGMPTVSAPVLTAASVERQVYPGKTALVRAAIFNPMPEPLRGVVTVELPPGFEQPPGLPVEAGPRQTATVDFTIKVPTGISDKQDMQATLAGPAGPLQTVTYLGILPVCLSAPAAWTTNAPVIDGDLSEWGDPAAFAIKIDRPAQVVEGIPFTKSYLNNQLVDWRGPADAAARAAIRYDASNLYFAVRVYDDILANTNSASPATAETGDAVEFFLDGRAMAGQAGDTYTPDVFHVVFTPPVKSLPAPACHWLRPRDNCLEAMAYASAPLTNGYTLEVRAPLYNFKFRQEAVPGNAFGFDLAATDRDEPKSERSLVRSRLRWTGDVEADANPAHFGRVVFLKR